MDILHPKVLEVVDKLNLTPLQGLIIQFLSDPEEDYTSTSIASMCQGQLGQGSKRHVRRIKQDLSAHIDSILLARELELQAEDHFTTIDNVDPKGGNGADKEGIIDMGDGGWDVTEQLDCVTACSKAPDKAFVFVSSVARKKINLFMKWAGHQEWLAYLVGKWISDHEVEVIDLVLPSQNASETLVNKVIMVDDEYTGIVGVIHSHHEMGGAGSHKAGFSGHDEAFINSNHNLSLLVAKDGIAGHIRVKTPCGAFLRVIAKVKHLDEVEVNEKKLQAEFKEKIKFGRGVGRGWTGNQHKVLNASEIDRDNYHFDNVYKRHQ